jgi:hypothetical protein
MCIKKVAAVSLVLVFSVVVLAKSAPIGTVSSCKVAAILGTDLVPGTTIFSGDKIVVGSQGSVWVSMQGGGQVQVFENSTVVFTKSPDSIRVTLDRGQARINGKNVVLTGASRENNLFQENAGVGHDNRGKDKDRDCEISKDSRKIKPCRDDID